MTSRPTRGIGRALLSKGFERSNSHHRFLDLVVDGVPTEIGTRLSHGIDEYGDDLLAKVARHGFTPPAQYRVRRSGGAYFLLLGDVQVARLDDERAARALQLATQTTDEACDVVVDVACDQIGDGAREKARELARLWERA